MLGLWRRLLNLAKSKKSSEPSSENIERAFNYLKFYATNIYGAVTTQDFRLELLNEKIKENGKWY